MQNLAVVLSKDFSPREKMLMVKYMSNNCKTLLVVKFIDEYAEDILQYNVKKKGYGVKLNDKGSP